MSNGEIPSQERTDWSDPRQHAAWVFPGMPLTDGGGFMSHPDTYGDWSEHVVNAGFTHVDYLRSLANDEGFIHVDQLPKQTIEHHQPQRGADHWLNPTGKWVKKGTPRPKVTKAPDMEKYTAMEQAESLEQMARMGRFSPELIEQMAAEGLIRADQLVPEPFRMPDPVIDTSALDNRNKGSKGK